MEVVKQSPANFVIEAHRVPIEFFEKRDVTKKYFRRFGKVKFIKFKPKSCSLIIEYNNEEGMLNALELAGEYNGQVFIVSRDTHTNLKKKKSSKKNVDKDWTADPEVRAELEAMGAFGPTKTYDLRSTAMMVDTVETPSIGLKKRERKWQTSSPKPHKKKTEEIELENIIKQQAFSVEDRYKILDARDKLIRFKLKKNVEFSKSPTVGTCPDMCPEKERLMRETQHQVALYEQSESGNGKEMNPRLAVKQYSRSSADQEAPLPQELRPVAVLQMTMGYLMHRIMGLCDYPEVNLAEWYHFLWDRTRGIRKDITQQELCCQGSVELVEQCARFHIFCSARLVNEDLSVFDQKINTENLTKCLQTLKYMYHDLQLKGESCPNEPEFRAYIILLNLNDGNFMWEVQQLKQSIQQSKEVRFALNVYSSLDKHNYVKFFTLVNSTTFLNACILMRYFTQMRVTALKTLIKSYSSPRALQTITLPLRYITKILAFEDEEAAIDFITSFGLKADIENGRVLLDKPMFTDPQFPLDRAINLVESKRDKSIGEVVCGKELPPKIYESHTPHNSFNSEGFLIFEEIDDVDNSVKHAEPKVHEDRRDNTRNIFVPIQEQDDGKIEPARSVWSRITTTTTTPPPPPPPISTPISIFVSSEPKIELEPDKIETLPLPSLPIINEKKIDEEIERKRQEELETIRKREETRKREVEARRRAELEEKQRKEAAALKKKLAQEEAERKRRKAHEIKIAVHAVIDNLIKTVDERVRIEGIAKISLRIRQRKLRKYLEKWRENSRRKRKRKAADFQPMFIGGSKSVKEEAEELRTLSENLALANIKRYKKGQPLEILLNNDNDINKINLIELTYKLLTKRFLELNQKLHQELFWKVTISIPNESEFNCGLNFIVKTLNNAIQWKEKNSTTVLIDQSKTSPTLTYCLEKQTGGVVLSNNHTNGFIFIANDFNDHLRKRIVENFQNFGVFTKLPIVLALQNYDEKKSNLQALIKEGIISDYLIIIDKFTSRNLVNIIEEALIFLSTRVEKPPPLELDTLRSFLAKYLCQDVWKRANSFAKWNNNYKNCLKIPNTVIYLYNDAVDKLKAILLNKACKEFSKFPEIFKKFLRSEIPDSLPCDYKYFPTFWDNPSYVNHIEKILNSLSLPKLVEDWPPQDQYELQTIIRSYCKIFKNPQTIFYKMMGIFLKDPNDVSNVPWTEIIELLAWQKLEEIDFSLYGTGFVNKSIYNQLIVVYDVNTLNDYVKSDWFYIKHPIVKQKILQLLSEEKVVEVVQEEECIENFDLDQILAKIQQPPRYNANKIKNELKDCKNLLADLEDTLLVHKKILEKSGNFLQMVVEKS